ncbi:copper fist DNA binding domain-containing protein, partial [Lineolata rhizophorae]
MPIIDGEKYACASCIKGHRVSGCQHIDRELRHINPKGRPVKQCEHCRGARKSKSHHAKCDC